MSLRTLFTKTAALATPAIIALTGLSNEAAGQNYHQGQPIYEHPIYNAPPTYVQPTILPSPTIPADKGAKTYIDTLNDLDQNHVSGKTNISHNIMAQAALQSILKHVAFTKFADPSTNAFDGNKITFKPGTLDVQTLTLPSGRTIQANIPQHLNSYTDQANALRQFIQPLSTELNLSANELYGHGIKGAISVSRDKHTKYYTEAEQKAAEEERTGIFVGIGASIAPKNGFIEIIEPLPNSPAEKSGLKKGDLITHVNGESIENRPMDESVKKIKGEIGTTVSLTIKKTDGQTLTQSVLREEIVNDPTEGSELIDNIAHIKFSHFYDNSHEAFIKRIQLMQAEANKKGHPSLHYIIDLRNNGGGSELSALIIPDLFIEDLDGEKDTMYVRGTPPTGRKASIDDFTITAHPSGEIQTKLPSLSVTALQNQHSASGSEIVSATLQDEGIKVIGTRSYGKGSAQGINNNVQSTRDMFYAGSRGRSTQGSGVIPNIQIIYNDFRDAELANFQFENSGNAALIHPSKTRASDTPEKTYALKPNYAGELSKERITQLPKELQAFVTDHLKNTGYMVKVIDAEKLAAFQLIKPKTYSKFFDIKDSKPKPQAQTQPILSFGS